MSTKPPTEPTKGLVVPNPEEIQRTKKMIKEILEMQKKQDQFKMKKEEKKQSMKLDKEALNSALDEIGSNKKLNDKDKEYIVKKVPAKWYKKRTIKILLQAVEAKLGKEGLDKVKEKMKEKRKSILSNCTDIDYKIVIQKEEDKAPAAKKRKTKSKQKAPRDATKKRQRFIQKLAS